MQNVLRESGGGAQPWGRRMSKRKVNGQVCLSSGTRHLQGLVGTWSG